MIRTVTLAVGLLSLAACSSMPPVDQAVVDKNALSIQKQIVAACVNSGFFKMADGMLTAAVPAAALPVALVNAGVDKICADPAHYAQGASAIAYVVKVTADALKAQAVAATAKP